MKKHLLVPLLPLLFVLMCCSSLSAQQEGPNKPEVEENEKKQDEKQKENSELQKYVEKDDGEFKWEKLSARELPGGCGTTRYCATCGAAIAIVVSLSENQPQRRVCLLTAERQGRLVDLYFEVQSAPLVIEGRRFLLLFLRDVTIEQQRAVMERVFFHDIKNHIGSLLLNVELLVAQAKDPRTRELGERIRWISSRLRTEVEIQRTLSAEGSATYTPVLQEVCAEEIVHELQGVFTSHSVSQGKSLRLVKEVPSLRLTTDPSLLHRVLANMVINGFEATEEGGEVRLWVTHEDDGVSFHVWSEQAIPEDVGLRVFQRNFSTKEGSGRGLGTYAMTLFGETCLGGRVDFTTSREGGTEFHLRLPLELSAKDENRRLGPSGTD